MLTGTKDRNCTKNRRTVDRHKQRRSNSCGMALDVFLEDDRMQAIPGLKKKETKHFQMYLRHFGRATAEFRVTRHESHRRKSPRGLFGIPQPIQFGKKEKEILWEQHKRGGIIIRFFFPLPAPAIVELGEISLRDVCAQETGYVLHQQRRYRMTSKASRKRILAEKKNEIK